MAEQVVHVNRGTTQLDQVDLRWVRANCGADCFASRLQSRLRTTPSGIDHDRFVP
jgi:hypothetical protein